MTNSEARLHLCRWTQKLYEIGVVTGEGSVSLRIGDYMLITPAECPIGSCSPDDLIEVNIETRRIKGRPTTSPFCSLHADIYKKRNDFQAIVNSHQTNCVISSRAGLTVHTFLDDMAQIVGPTARVARFEIPVDERSITSTLKALKRHNAALLSNHGAICGAQTLDDACAVAQVLEKNCKAAIETSFLGGGVRINRLETMLMRYVYLWKYSKQNKKNIAPSK